LADKWLCDSALFRLYLVLWIALILVTWLAGYDWPVVRQWGAICSVAFSPLFGFFILFAIWGIGGLLILPLLQMIPLFAKAWKELMALIHEATAPR